MSRAIPPTPDGMRWCSRCRKFQPLAEFTPKDFYCSVSRRAYERERSAIRAVAPKRPPPPKPAPPPPPPKKRGWRGLPVSAPIVEAPVRHVKADAVPAGEPWTREATEHEAAMLAHGAQVVSQIRAAHFALDVITSGWALMNKAEAKT